MVVNKVVENNFTNLINKEIIKMAIPFDTRLEIWEKIRHIDDIYDLIRIGLQGES